jgi:hypothetical protein
MRLLAISCVVTLALATAGLSLHRVFRITPDQLVGALRLEAPPGTGAQRLLAILDSMGAEHSQAVFAKNGDSEFRTPGRRIYAAIRNLRRGKLLSDGVFLVAALDAEDRVIDYRAYYSYTGP